MISSPVIHPPLLRALAAAGHGALVLIADANYPISTATRAAAPQIHLGLRPGLLDGLTVLQAILEVMPVEAARIMDSGAEPAPAVADYRAALPHIDLEPVARNDFYTLARSDDLAVVIGTGERRLFGNLLLTVGAVPPSTKGRM